VPQPGWFDRPNAHKSGLFARQPNRLGAGRAGRWPGTRHCGLMCPIRHSK
jgi:hypothetical protein